MKRRHLLQPSIAATAFAHRKTIANMFAMVKVKNQHDPANLFRLNANVKPTA